MFSAARKYFFQLNEATNAVILLRDRPGLFDFLFRIGWLAPIEDRLLAQLCCFRLPKPHSCVYFRSPRSVHRSYEAELSWVLGFVNPKLSTENPIMMGKLAGNATLGSVDCRALLPWLYGKDHLCKISS